MEQQCIISDQRQPYLLIVCPLPSIRKLAGCQLMLFFGGFEACPVYLGLLSLEGGLARKGTSGGEGRTLHVPAVCGNGLMWVVWLVSMWLKVGAGGCVLCRQS